jgi:hypothetical protein
MNFIFLSSLATATYFSWFSSTANDVGQAAMKNIQSILSHPPPPVVKEIPNAISHPPPPVAAAVDQALLSQSLFPDWAVTPTQKAVYKELKEAAIKSDEFKGSKITFIFKNYIHHQLDAYLSSPEFRKKVRTEATIREIIKSNGRAKGRFSRGRVPVISNKR